MGRADLASKWILLTGASSGLGKEMARYLASKCRVNLVLVARRAGLLESLSNELREKSESQVITIAADLSNPDEVERVFREATSGRKLHGAILNAGVTYFGEHEKIGTDELANILQLNIISTSRLGDLMSRHLIGAQEPGRILLISSMAGHIPLPYQAAYSASKGFISNLGVAMGRELRKHGISVTVFAPGGIQTDMITNSGLHRLPGARFLNQSAASCAKTAVNAMRKRRLLATSNIGDAIALFIAGMVPYSFITWGLEKLYRPALPAEGAREKSTPASHRPVVEYGRLHKTS